MTSPFTDADIRLVDFPETRVAVLEHRGDPALIDESIGRFVAFRKRLHLSPRTNATFNILYGDPGRTPPADFRVDLCVATDRAIGSDEIGIEARVIPGGRCAVLRLVGAEDRIGAALRYLRADWLPRSGEALRDFPLYLQRVRFFPEVPEDETVIDLFLPLNPRE